MGTVQELSIIKGANRTITFQPLHRIIEDRIERGAGEKTAIIINNAQNEEQRISYNEFNANANRLGRFVLERIADKQLGPNQDGDWIIAVCMPPSDELLITLLAIWKAGAAYLPIDPTFPTNRIEHILTEAKPVLVIYDQNSIDSALFAPTSDAVSYTLCQRQFSDYDGANIASNQTLTSDKGIDLLGLVLYTSGSTGIPKGVRLPHSIVLNRLKWQWETFPYSATEDVGVFKTALTFVDSVAEIWGPLLNDMAIVVIPKEVTRDPNRLVTVLQSYKIERLVLVPTLLKSLLTYLSLKSDSSLLRNLKTWVCSGETLPVSLANEFYDYFAEDEHILCNFYGSTEIMGDVTYFVCKRKKQLELYVNVPIGYPIFNTVIYILDSNKMPVQIGQTGELFVAGLNLADGYVNGRDKDRFIENPLTVNPKYARLYRTGDYASVGKGRIIQYEGRTDSQIKLRGHRVDLSEIEKQLLSIKHVEKGIVLCYHAGQIDQAILAFATTKAESPIQQAIQIENMLRDRLADYMVPQVVLIERVPLLVNGKIDRQSLLKMYENTNNNNDDPQILLNFDYSGVLCSDFEKCKILFETIGEVIGRSTRTTLSLQSNFYALGGNSLNSIFTVAALRSKGYFIDISDFLSAPNLRELMARITETESDPNQMLRAPNDSRIEMSMEPLAMQHKEDTIEIITKSFIEKAELEQQLKPHIHYTDYAELMDAIWEPLIEKAYSFIVKNDHNRTIGVALNFDANDEPEAPMVGGLCTIFLFLDYLEVPIKERLPKDRPILHSFMMGTVADLSPQENVAVMSFMENEVLKLAKKRGCVGVLTTNTSALTQQLAENVYGYETLLDYQVNQYIVDGYRPFGKAPDHYRAIVQYKKV